MSLLTTHAPAVDAHARALRSPGGLLLLMNGAALLAAAVLLRVYRLDAVPGVNGDEAWSGVQALRMLRGQPIEWWTPNGNPVNPFFLLPLVALHALLPPSIALLRFVSLASGLAALGVNYVLCRRAFDTRTAVISTWLLALLPIDVAYSRFAWDASQSLLATLPVLYLPLVRRRAGSSRGLLLGAALMALAAAILVHPTNVFAAVLLIVPLIHENTQPIGRMLQATAVGAKTWTLAALVGISAAVVFWSWHALLGAAARLHGPSELARFAENYLRLFSGTTVYAFLSGVNSGGPNEAWFACLPAACDWFFGCAAVGALVGMLQRLTRQGAESDASLVLGWFAMLAGFFLVAGPGAMSPHYERYAVCLIAPGGLLLSRGWAWWIDGQQPHRKAGVAALALAAWLWPISFYLGYFEFIERTGGRSHGTFRTAAVEPKLQALRWVIHHRTDRQPVRIVCHEWWNYRPLEYLAMGQENVEVLTWEEWQRATGSQDARPAENTWFVEFAGTRSEAEVLARFQAAGLDVHSEAIYDYGRHKLLSVIGQAENFSKNY